MITTNNPTPGTGVDTAADSIANLLTDDLTIVNTPKASKNQEPSKVEPNVGQSHDANPESHEEPTEQTDESETHYEDESGDGPTDEVESEEESNTPESEDHDSVSDDTTFSIHDGESDRSVTLAELKKGWLRQSDYTKKAQALAEDRKVLATAAQEAQQEREQYRNGLAQVAQLMQQLTPQEPTPEQWQMLQQNDPVGFLTQREQWREHKDQMARLANEYQALTQKQEQDHLKQLQGKFAEEGQKLMAAFPEWKDAAKADAGKKAIRDYASKLGYSDQEINATTDHRIFVLAHKALMYDTLVAKGQPRPTQDPTKTKVIRPGAAGQTPNSRKSAVHDARKQLARTGNVNDAASLLAKLL
ncbi:hypothetical protein [Paraburkholderia caribensis]|uniref:hypothetical protein n=1 Tax=Paraburkholderia caribensis TaxID=75105 RepID=UPI00159286AF|nr:hypothetical protein [Paraburkholderia caribensis]